MHDDDGSYAADLEMDLRHEASGEWPHRGADLPELVPPVACDKHPWRVAADDWPHDPPVPPPRYFDFCDECLIEQPCDGCGVSVPVGVLHAVEAAGQLVCPDCAVTP